jgi:hypothetical protein
MSDYLKLLVKTLILLSSSLDLSAVYVCERIALRNAKIAIS